ncbi:hypothetical protein BGZ50_000763 [Haplosporangium sp. Z 11]|nr:hypothetical protein BGZ50_000763 [Haplosporangium sp. Z 11]
MWADSFYVCLSEIILASILAQKESQAKSLQQPLQRTPSSSPSTPVATTNPASRAITIVDPTSRTPLYIPPTPVNAKVPNGSFGRSGRYSGSTTPATAGLMAQSDSYFNHMPAMSRQQQQQQQQQQLFNSMYGSHAYQFAPQSMQHQQAYSMGMVSPTAGSYSPPRMASRIPIVNPDNGSIVSVPEASSSSSAWHQSHFVAVR